MSKLGDVRRRTAADLIGQKQRGEKIVSLTAYDYSTAKVLDQTGVVDFILVGDSLGMVVLGYPDTLSVTLEDMLHHVKGVSRGVKTAMVVADMPFMSVHVDFESAVRHVGRMMQEGRAQAVKLEGATDLTLRLVRHLTQIGVPVMGHLGLTPQSVNTLGGYKVQGKSLGAVEQLIQDARALEAAGAFALVLEMIPQEVAGLVSRLLAIPTIGIGAGPACDGQILVIDDFLGKFPDFKPRFARMYMTMAQDLQAAVHTYATDIVSGDFPHPRDEAFSAPADLLAELPALEARYQSLRSEETVVSLFQRGPSATALGVATLRDEA